MGGVPACCYAVSHELRCVIVLPGLAVLLVTCVSSSCYLELPDLQLVTFMFCCYRSAALVVTSALYTVVISVRVAASCLGQPFFCDIRP